MVHRLGAGGRVDEGAGRGGAGNVGVGVLARAEVVGKEEHAVVADLGVVERAPPGAGAGLVGEAARGRLEARVEGFEARGERVVEDDVAARGRRGEAERDADERPGVERG
ncbi:MAG: hypothetical protein AAGI91_16440 [Bacteroidota bacterium]